MAVVAAVAANATAGNLKPPEVPGLPLIRQPRFSGLRTTHRLEGCPANARRGVN